VGACERNRNRLDASLAGWHGEFPVSTQTEFLAVLARQFGATCETHTDDNDGWIQRVYLFPRFPDNARDDFVYAFNASNLFESFSIDYSNSSTRLYVEFKAER
jgi:hypothetical protein